MGILNLLRLRIKRKAKQSEKELASLSANFKRLEELQRTGLLLWDAKQRRLFLEQPLALIMMRKEETWKNFLKNCYAWIFYNECAAAVDTLIIDEELKAVRRAKKMCNTLTMRDINRIKEAKRNEISLEDCEKNTPEVKPFEFFVIRENSEAVPLSKNKGGTGDEDVVPGGEIFCIGQYDPDENNFVIALWEDVKFFMQHGNKNNKDTK